jgi:hypothetical protein
MATLEDSITAITASRPPETDPLTYLTIVELHLGLHPELLSTLDELLQDQELAQNIGWDLIHILLPMEGDGAIRCLDTIARLGNPREVVLKITEALTLLDLEAGAQDDDDNDFGDDKSDDTSDETPLEKGKGKNQTDGIPTIEDRFCTLVNLLSIVHPRIKTKYPSRFLSTSLIAVLTAYRPSAKATLSVLSFVHSISGRKRPPLPGRKSSTIISSGLKGSSANQPSAPDPEATSEDPKEAAIQTKLLQSFTTHILEVYVNENGMEWAARLQEFYEPGKIVVGRTSYSEAYKKEPSLEERVSVVGQLVVCNLGMYDPINADESRLWRATSDSAIAMSF